MLDEETGQHIGDDVPNVGVRAVRLSGLTRERETAVTWNS